MDKQIIQYGFGLDYLKSWSIQHALREIFQNYLDYGQYQLITTEEKNTGNIIVKISNTYTPTNLEFLRIGNSGKRNDKNTIGQHGEGLKMAFLIFKREGLKVKLRTQTHTFEPVSYNNELGECFGIAYYKHNNKLFKTFDLLFTIPKTYYDTFIKTIITKKDILYTSPTYGRIVAKPKGDIFVGGLFVCSNKNFSRAYDFNPKHIQLDRDRAMPSHFEIKWVTARLMEEYGKFKASDVQYEDMEYVNTISNKEIKKFKPAIINGNVEFTTDIKEKDGTIKRVVVHHSSLKEKLRTSSIFEKAILALKMFVLKKLGITEMLEKYKKDYPMYGEALKDFNLIINNSQHS